MPQDYFAPAHLDEALDLLRDRALKIVAGGTDVFPAQGRAPFETGLLDITRIADLHGIRREPDGSVRIGAAATWTELIRADLPTAFDALRESAREVGSVQIQNAGTVAGNLCNASPAADGVPPLMILDAEVELAGPTGTRMLPLDAFVEGVRKTALAPGEIATAIRVPPVPHGARSAFEKLGARRYLVISIAMTAALVVLDSAGRIAVARVAVGACSPVAVRLPALEAALAGSDPGDVAIGAGHLAPLAPIADIRGDAAYRLEAAAVQVARAVRRAAGHG